MLSTTNNSIWEVPIFLKYQNNFILSFVALTIPASIKLKLPVVINKTWAKSTTETRFNNPVFGAKVLWYLYQTLILIINLKKRTDAEL